MPELTPIPAAELAELRERLSRLSREKADLEQIARQYSVLSGIIEGSIAPVFSLDRAYRYVIFNRSHAESMRASYGAEIEVGECFLDYMTVEADREEAKRSLERVLAGERIVKLAYVGEGSRTRRCFEILHHPVLSDRGEVVGVAAFANDVTDRVRSEEELRESEEKFAAAFRASPSLIAITRAADGSIVDVNDGYRRLLGYSRDESIGRTTAEMSIWADPADRVAFVDGLRSCGEVNDLETTLRRKDGTLVAVSDSARKIRLQGEECILSVAHDITERKRAERRLRLEAECGSQLLSVFERSPEMSDKEIYDEVLDLAVRATGSAIGFFHRLSDDERTIILTSWNRAALENCTAAFETHYPIESAGNWVDCVRLRAPVVYNDYPSSPARKGYPPGHSPVLRFMSVPVIEGGRVRIIFGVGNKVEEYDEGDVVRLQQVANELQKIIRQRRTSQRLVFLGRLYRTISEINQVIVREKDRDRLFAEVCRIGVEHGEFAMVWAGLADRLSGIVRPIAAAGPESGYADELVVRLDAPAAELRPAARAILEDRVVLVDDTETDPGFAPWREAAHQHGFRSCAAFPFQVGEARGVLKVYAAVPDVFHDEVAALLVELAADLGFALNALETDQHRVEAERALRRSEGSLKEAQRIAHIGNWDLDLERNVLSWSDEIYHIFELDRSRFEASYEAFLDAIHPDDRAFVDGAYTESVRTKTPYEITHRLQMPDGRVKHVVERCETFYDEDGRPRRSVGTIQDVTDRVRAERELSRANRALRMLSDTNQALMRIPDEAMLLQEVCRIVVEEGGYPTAWVGYAERDEAKTLRRVAHAGFEPESLYPARASWGDVDRGRGPEATSIRTGEACVVRFSPGDPMPSPSLEAAVREGFQSAVALPLRSEGETLGSLGIYSGERDAFDAREVGILMEMAGDLAVGITALRANALRRSAEAKVRQLNAELESRVTERTAELAEAVQELESFSYSVSHDLRAPLRAIDGFSRLLESQIGGDLDEEARHCLQTILRNTKQMGRLIDDLLALARSSRVELRKSTIDMNDLVRQVLDEALAPADRARAEVHLADLPAAWGDAGLIRVVLQNLLSNAIKYSAPRDPRRIEVGFRRAPDGPEFFVRDNGVGFDPRYQGKLFGVFQRLHAATEFEGTGIGLALVKRIVNRHGGRVWAEGAVDRGATFWFSLEDADAASGFD